MAFREDTEAGRLAPAVFVSDALSAAKSSSISLRAGDACFLAVAFLAVVFFDAAFLAVAFLEAFLEAFFAGLLLELSAMCITVPRGAKESICNKKEHLGTAVCRWRVF